MWKNVSIKESGKYKDLRAVMLEDGRLLWVF